MLHLVGQLPEIMEDFFYKIKSCASYELEEISICRGINTITSFFLKTPETTGIFDNGLFIVFICIFISFFLSSIYTVFLEDIQYLKRVRSKIIKSTNSVILVLRTFNALKESVDSNYELENEIIGRNKLESDSIEEFLQIGDTDLHEKHLGDEIITFLPDHEVPCPAALEGLDLDETEDLNKKCGILKRIGDVSFIEKKIGKNLHVLYSKKAESNPPDTRGDKMSISSNDTKGCHMHRGYIHKTPLETPSKARYNIYSNLHRDVDAVKERVTKGGIFARRKIERSKAKSATTVDDKKILTNLPAWK